MFEVEIMAGIIAGHRSSEKRAIRVSVLGGSTNARRTLPREGLGVGILLARSPALGNKTLVVNLVPVLELC